MEITEVRIRKVNFEGRTRAFASITLDREFVIHDIKIIQGDDGLFIAMPHRRLPNGERRDVAHPITNTFRQQVQDRVLEEFHRSEQLSGRQCTGSSGE